MREGVHEWEREGGEKEILLIKEHCMLLDLCNRHTHNILVCYRSQMSFVQRFH